MDPCWKTLNCVYNRTILFALERTSSRFKLEHEHEYEQPILLTYWDMPAFYWNFLKGLTHPYNHVTESVNQNTLCNARLRFWLPLHVVVWIQVRSCILHVFDPDESLHCKYYMQWQHSISYLKLSYWARVLMDQGVKLPLIPLHPQSPQVISNNKQYKVDSHKQRTMIIICIFLKQDDMAHNVHTKCIYKKSTLKIVLKICKKKTNLH